MGLFNKNENKNEIVILSPVDGKIKPLSKVNDEVFAGEMVGKGVAVTPKSSKVTSPVKGKVTVAFETGHAYGISTKQGPELLVHIGVDTVGLGGEGFDKKAIQGQSVTPTSELATIDIKYIKKNAKSDDIIVVITNETFGDYSIKETFTGDVKQGEPLFILSK